MTTNFIIEARRFPVTVRDNRTGDITADSIVIDKQRLQAARIVGESSKELITRHYARAGLEVLEIGKPERKTINIDLGELWNLHDKADSE